MSITSRNGVTTFWSEIWRAGEHITRTRSIGKNTSLTEYWRFPARQIAMLKVGEVSVVQGGQRYLATRLMKEATQTQEFRTEQAAECWIARSDRLHDRFAPLDAAGQCCERTTMKWRRAT